MPLTDVAIRNAKPGEKAIKLSDGSGMFLLVTPAGGKLWRLKYRLDGKEKLLAMGASAMIGDSFDGISHADELRLSHRPPAAFRRAHGRRPCQHPHRPCRREATLDEH